MYQVSTGPENYINKSKIDHAIMIWIWNIFKGSCVEGSIPSWWCYREAVKTEEGGAWLEGRSLRVCCWRAHLVPGLYLSVSVSLLPGQLRSEQFCFITLSSIMYRLIRYRRNGASRPWTEISEILSQNQSFAPLSWFAQVVCHSNEKLTNTHAVYMVVFIRSL